MIKIDAIIVVKDNPVFIEKTLDSIKNLVRQIIIVDIGIDPDLAANLKKSKKNKVIKINEKVPYVELIREKTKEFSDAEYLVFLDPDEVLPKELIKIIKEKLEYYDYVSIPRKNIIFNRWIKHSRWWPDYQTRIFKKDKVIWPKIIHRQPKTIGTGLKIEPKEELAMIHHNYVNLDEYLSKAMRYARYEAREFILNNIHLTFTETIRRALNEFVSRYFAAQGYKDGIQGFMLSFLQMFNYFLVYFYYLEMNKYKDDPTIKPEHFFMQGLKETLHWKQNKSIKENIIKKIL